MNTTIGAGGRLRVGLIILICLAVMADFAQARAAAHADADSPGARAVSDFTAKASPQG